LLDKGTPQAFGLRRFFMPVCRSELAREKPEGAALIQDASVIVNDHREQARSYKVWIMFALCVQCPLPCRRLQ